MKNVSLSTKRACIAVAVALLPGAGGALCAAAATDAPATEAAPVEPGTAGEEAMPEMTQAEKSWEGRLRKREEELEAFAETI